MEPREISPRSEYSEAAGILNCKVYIPEEQNRKLTFTDKESGEVMFIRMTLPSAKAEGVPLNASSD